MTTKDTPTCRQVRPLLSEALDQRLSQGESVAVRAHLLACPGCRQSFAGLRQLQSWTREMPRSPVPADFQPELVRRIQTGEGTPVALLRGPVAALHRWRLFASGALTAAALLVSAWLVFDGLHQPASPNGVATDTALAGPMPVTPASLAEQVLARSAASLESLQRDASAIRDLPPNHASAKLLERSRDAYYGLKLIQNLQPQLLEVPEPVARQIAGVELALARVLDLQHLRQRSRADVDRAIDGILQVRISPDLLGQVRIRPQQQSVDIGDMLHREWSRDPQQVRELSLVVQRLFEESARGIRVRVLTGPDLTIGGGSVKLFGQPLFLWATPRK